MLTVHQKGTNMAQQVVCRHCHCVFLNRKQHGSHMKLVLRTQSFANRKAGNE